MLREDIDTAIAVLRTYVADRSKARTVRERRKQEVIDELQDGDR